MWTLPTSLRAKIAVATLFGIFLIPLTTSSLRGLTHVLTCTDRVDATLSVDTTAQDQTVLLGADSVTRDEDEVDNTLCDGLRVDLSLASTTSRHADVLVAITNDTEFDWRGTIELRLEGTPIPVAIGRIRSHTTATDTVDLRVHGGRSYDISGTLLIGP